MAGLTGDATYQVLNNGIVRDEYGKVISYNLEQGIKRYDPTQSVKAGITGAIISPIGAKVVETSVNKWGPYKNFDLNNPETFKNSKLKTVERYMDRYLDGKNGYEKSVLRKGIGVKYYKPKGGGKSYQLNHGYEDAIIIGTDGQHNHPYLKTTIGSTKVHIPLK